VNMADEAFVHFSQISAYAIPDADGGAGEGSSDPYVVFTIHCDEQSYTGRTRAIQNAGRNVVWEEACQITIPHDLALERSTIEVQVWDEDKDYGQSDQLMGTIPIVTHPNGRTHLELDGATLTQVNIQGHGKLYDFKFGFVYECYIPGVSLRLPGSQRAAPQSTKRAPTRLKTLARGAHQYGRVGAASMHLLPFRHVQLDASGVAHANTTPFDAYLYVNDIRGTRRAAERLAIVAHPMEASSERPMETARAAIHAATIPLHHRLTEQGWNVLAYEAHALYNDGCGDAELAKLRAAVDYCREHRLLRYCRISLLTQGTGASAALRAVHDFREEFDGVKVISACEPAGDPGLRDAVLARYAPQCTVPIIFLDGSGTAAEQLPQLLPPFPQRPMTQQVARRLPATVPHHVVIAHNYPLAGNARRLEGLRYFGDYPEKLIPFLDDHARSLALKPVKRPLPPLVTGGRASLQASPSLPQVTTV